MNLGDWLERNPTSDELIYIPHGNPESLKYRISTFITLPSCSVDPTMLARQGFMYDSYKNAQCFSCGCIVSKEELKNAEILELRHSRDCEFAQEIGGNVQPHGKSKIRI